jgi:Ran GTPase-activating protein (RanGAP) involved in mRNA processing and transport
VISCVLACATVPSKYLNEHLVLPGAAGATGLAYALTCIGSPLELLDLRLNIIGNQGVIDLCSALASSDRPQELIVAGCGFTEEAAIKVGQMLQQNTTLQALDVSNNYLGEVSSLVFTAQ